MGSQGPTWAVVPRSEWMSARVGDCVIKISWYYIS
jgi:hypothetical protein